MPRFTECWRCGKTDGFSIICASCEVAKYCSKNCQKNDIFRHEAECIPASIHKTCTTCRTSGRNVKACTGCYRAYYCDVKCQRNDWKKHKIQCNDVHETIKTLALCILGNFSHSWQIAQLTDGYYYWGNTIAYDCLNLMENEGDDYRSALNILFLGVGDLRNVALTCASLPDSYNNKVLFTLNDNESCVLARLVLFLFMLIRGNSNTPKMVIELWYSLLLNASTYKYLTNTLEHITSISSSEDMKSQSSGLINIKAKQLEKLQIVWKKWLYLPVRGTRWIQEQRTELFRKNEENYRFDPTYIQSIPKQHASSTRKYIKDGDFRRKPLDTPPFAENPTLTGYKQTSPDGPYSYAVQWDGLPFFGWDYLQVKKFNNSSSLITMFGEYIEHVLQIFQSKLSTQQISFQVVLCDCMEIKQHLETNTLYDRILTTNLMDYILLPALLNLCSEMLNHRNNDATIITETLTWSGDYCPPITLSEAQIKLTAAADVKRYPNSDNDHPNPSILEYIEDSWDFYNCLRGLFYAYMLKKKTITGCHIKPPSIKDLGKEFKLRLRDGYRNENKIVFFKMSANRRTVSSLEGDERFLEWAPSHKD